jgi:hypothetical protein
MYEKLANVIAHLDAAGPSSQRLERMLGRGSKKQFAVGWLYFDVS